MSFNYLSSRIPFWHFDHKNIMVFADGSLGGGFRLQGFDLNCKLDDEVNHFNQAIENLLTSMGEGVRLQVFYRMASNVAPFLDEHKKISQSAPKVSQSVVKARIEHLEKLQSSFFVPEIYFFVRSQPYQYKKRKFFEKRKDFETISEKDYNAYCEDFLQVLGQVKNSLVHAGLGPKRLHTKEWFDLCFDYLNLDRLKRVGRPSLRQSDMNIGEQLALTDLEVERDCLKIGGLYFRCITLKTPPEGFTYSAMAHEFTQLPFHFWLSQNIEVISQSKELAALQLKRRVAFSMSGGSIADIENESKLEDIEGLLRELLTGSEKLLQSDFTVIIWASTKKELESKTDYILKAFREMNQAEGIVETLPCFDIFMNSLPGCCTGMRHLKLKSSNIAHLMPLYAPWSGGKRPVCLIPTRENSLFSFDPFDPQNPNWNGLVFGGSGSGKSFTIAQLMLMFYGQ